MFDVIVIGGGPGGVSAALYAVSRGLKSLILEKEKIGGMIGRISNVTHYTGIISQETGETFADRIKTQVENAGVEIIYEEVIDTDFTKDIKVIKTDKGSYESKVVIIASGTIPKKLNIPGENEFYQRGIVQNAKRDFEKFKGKTVFVAGGSDGACKEALFLSNYGKKVYIVHHSEKLDAIKEFTTQIAEKENMEVLLNTSIKEVKGDTEVDEVVLFNEKTHEEESITSPGLGIFIHIGANPANEFLNDIELENGYVKVNDKKETNIEGVYGVGDIRVTNIRQVSTAVADGTVAAINATSYINNKF